MQLKKLPEFPTHKLYVGVKFGRDGTNASMAIALKTSNKKVFVEVIDCKNMREGIGWIIDWLSGAANVAKIAIDGANGQPLMIAAMKEAKFKKPILPTVAEVIEANSVFEQAVFKKSICHMGQEQLTNVISNCEKRTIGNKGGFGYSALKPDTEIALMDSVILAHWLAYKDKETAKQQIKY